MSVFISRDGGISVFRVSVFVAIFGAIIVVAGLVIVEFERSARRSPISVGVYPGAEQFHQNDRGSTRRERAFRIPGDDEVSVQAVADFYQSEMDSFYDNNPRDPNREQCSRNPRAGNFAGYEPGSGLIAYEFYCLFDDTSDLGGQRETIVTIYPGTSNDSDPEAFDSTGFTVVVYDEIWAP